MTVTDNKRKQWFALCLCLSFILLTFTILLRKSSPGNIRTTDQVRELTETWVLLNHLNENLKESLEKHLEDGRKKRGTIPDDVLPNGITKLSIQTTCPIKTTLYKCSSKRAPSDSFGKKLFSWEVEGFMKKDIWTSDCQSLGVGRMQGIFNWHASSHVIFGLPSIDDSNCEVRYVNRSIGYKCESNEGNETMINQFKLTCRTFSETENGWTYINHVLDPMNFTIKSGKLIVHGSSSFFKTIVKETTDKSSRVFRRSTLDVDAPTQSATVSATVETKKKLTSGDTFQMEDILYLNYKRADLVAQSYDLKSADECYCGWRTLASSSECNGGVLTKSKNIWSTWPAVQINGKTMDPEIHQVGDTGDSWRDDVIVKGFCSVVMKGEITLRDYRDQNRVDDRLRGLWRCPQPILDYCRLNTRGGYVDGTWEDVYTFGAVVVSAMRNFQINLITYLTTGFSVENTKKVYDVLSKIVNLINNVITDVGNSLDMSKAIVQKLKELKSGIYADINTVLNNTIINKGDIKRLQKLMYNSSTILQQVVNELYDLKVRTRKLEISVQSVKDEIKTVHSDLLKVCEVVGVKCKMLIFDTIQAFKIMKNNGLMNKVNSLRMNSFAELEREHKEFGLSLANENITFDDLDKKLKNYTDRQKMTAEQGRQLKMYVEKERMRYKNLLQQFDEKFGNLSFKVNAIDRNRGGSSGIGGISGVGSFFSDLGGGVGGFLGGLMGVGGLAAGGLVALLIPGLIIYGIIKACQGGGFSPRNVTPNI